MNRPRERRILSDRERAAASSTIRHRCQGTGPTVHSAVEVSNRRIDAQFVRAAARGDLQAVRAMLNDGRITNVDVRTRNNSPRASTALHMASSYGEIHIVNLLLEHGADPCARLEWLRALTPLHVAATPLMAERLVLAGAQPVAMDPREPDPAVYHRQQGRHAVADVIAAARAPAPSATLAPAPMPITAVASKRTVPSLTAADISLIRACMGYEMLWDGSESLGDVECAVCMSDLRATPDPPSDGPPLILLPCGNTSANPHIYHAGCVERWLLRKATCPTCRSDVRPLLRMCMQQQQQQLPVQDLALATLRRHQPVPASADRRTMETATMEKASATVAPPVPPQRKTSFASRDGRVRAEIRLKQLVAPAPLGHLVHNAVGGTCLSDLDEALRQVFAPGPPCGSSRQGTLSARRASPRAVATAAGGGTTPPTLFPQVHVLPGPQSAGWEAAGWTRGEHGSWVPSKLRH